jgi:uncharacterized membrane protein YeaQ/YmgE (transglycosylase-associated protein family)
MPLLILIILIGFIGGTIARLLMPGPNTPTGFFFITMLGVASVILASFIGDAAGLYRFHQAAGIVGATVGAMIILFAWHRLVAWHIVPNFGV